MKHGGNIKLVAQQFGMQPSEMIDLSTGINPRAYPVDLSRLATEELMALPQSTDEQKLKKIMADAWAVPDSVEIALAPGSGFIISLLPYFCLGRYAEGRTQILCPEPVYRPHIEAWQEAGFTIESYPAHRLPHISDACAAIIAVQPGNPMGTIHPPQEWKPILDEAAGKGIMVAIDEAFIDLQPESSLVPYLGQRGQIVLRSFGKFYGLAGVRLGAGIGHPDDIAALSQMMGPWPVSSLALHLGTSAIRDTDWAEEQRRWLAEQMALMTSGLKARGVTIIGGTDLYCLITVDDANQLQTHLAQNGFWTRIFDEQPSMMRLGLPADHDIMTRFFDAFDAY